MMTLFFMLLGVFYEGVVLSNLWQWFVVPLGVPAISISTAIGLCLTIGIAAPKAVYSEIAHARESKAGDSVLIHLLYAGALPTVAMGLGWALIHIQ